jgi:hypothetical protein
MDNYSLLIQQLDAFIRKYYTNRLLRGMMVFMACLLLYVLLAVVGEYFLYFPSWLRYTLLIVLLVPGTAALIFWIMIPLLQMQRLGKVISHEQAAGIIGTHFPEVKDKLLNILQLKRQSVDAPSRELIEASIAQKSAELAPVPFVSAINLNANKKYLRYLLPPALALLAVVIGAPNIFRESSERLLQPSRTFEKKAPFEWIVRNTNLTVPQYTDWLLEVELKGNLLPDQVWVQQNGQQLLMERKQDNRYTYNFTKVGGSFTFTLQAGGYTSRPYAVKVVPKPVMSAFKVQLDYPDYTGRKDEVLDNLGDMIVPAGTRIGWAFQAQHTDAVQFVYPHSAVTLRQLNGLYVHQLQAMTDTAYSIVISNQYIKQPDSLHYRVGVIPDQFPSVSLQQYADSTTGGMVVLYGEANDDYGLRNINFVYQIKRSNNKQTKTGTVPIPAAKGLFASFNHILDVEQMQLQPGDDLSYYVEVWDNDGVHGSKSAKSTVMQYRMPDAQQMDSLMAANADKMEKGLKSSSNKAKELQKNMKALQEKMLQKSALDWEDKKALEQLAEKQQQMQQQLENVKEKLDQFNKQSEHKELSEELREKQQTMEKLMENLLNNDLKEQMKRLQELMERLNKEDAFKELNSAQQKNDLMQKDMERIKELMNKLEMQMRMEDLANRADSLAQKQGDLKQQTEQPNSDLAKKMEQQKQLQQQLNEMQKEMKEVDKLNEQLDSPQDMSDQKEQGQQAGEQMEQSQQQMQQQNRSKASQSQQKAQQNLQQMANMMRMGAGGLEMKQIELDIKATRQLLQNLIRMSFEQEEVMNTLRTTPPNAPGYVEISRRQQKLLNTSEMIADSLFVLSKRVFQLAPTVNKETADIKQHMENTIQGLEARNTGRALTSQQYIMTGTNNLALMLNELLQNLMSMQSQAMKMQSSGSCSKPGQSGKPKPGNGKQLSDIMTKQQQLGQGMQQMMNRGQGKPGQQGQQQPGQSGQQGQQGNGGEYGSAEELARMAAQQAAIRKQLQQLNQDLIKNGKGNSVLLNQLAQDMDRNETDLVNRRLTEQMMRRQQDILTRLLQAQDATRQQEEDNKRQSNVAKELPRSIPPALQDFLKNRQSAIDVYRTAPATLKPYFKEKVDQYYNLLQGK